MKFIANTTFRVIVNHAICWIIYIFYELCFSVFVFEMAMPLSNVLFFYTCNIGLFYWHFYSLGRYVGGYSIRYFPIIGIVIIEIIISVAIKIARDYFYMLNTVPPMQFRQSLKIAAGLDFNRTIQYLYFSTVIWSAINFGRFRRHTTEAMLRSALAEKAKIDLDNQFAQAQNAFLKQQINPHLLFNTLNTIYSSAYIHSPEDSKLVLLLSDIMRFSYEDADPQGRVPLKNEIKQLKNLIELNSYRFQKTVQLELNITGEPGEFPIIPLVLITLTENMFKHGDLRQTPRKLEISISPDGRLRYFSMNVPKPQGTHKKGTNIGLNNTKLRLDYAYPNNYDLHITETDELFSLELNINLAYERDHH
ncbi:histidine kinase [Mucilaginibacter sp. CAU 1740]|uniref:sensor histidine kinase n=1 Tax=Mucilaginibacter sp. CAU 1740 TaxID=3140365 RepID=UPI00325AC0AA